MSLLLDLKGYLRIDSTDTSFDTEIQDLISAVQTELIGVGLDTTMVNAATDSLIKKAITTYCKANFGYDTDNATAFSESYEKLKIFLMNNSTYQAVSS